MSFFTCVLGGCLFLVLLLMLSALPSWETEGRDSEGACGSEFRAPPLHGSNFFPIFPTWIDSNNDLDWFLVSSFEFANRFFLCSHSFPFCLKSMLILSDNFLLSFFFFWPSYFDAAPGPLFFESNYKLHVFDSVPPISYDGSFSSVNSTTCNSPLPCSFIWFRLSILSLLFYYLPFLLRLSTLPFPSLSCSEPTNEICSFLTWTSASCSYRKNESVSFWFSSCECESII